MKARGGQRNFSVDNSRLVVFELILISSVLITNLNNRQNKAS